MKHYKSLGYVGKPGEALCILEEHLPRGSGVKVEHKCDNCGKKFTREYRRICDTYDNFGQDLCVDCINKLKVKKSVETYKNKTGYEYSFQNPECKIKSKNTCLDRYDCVNPMQNQSIKTKQQNSLYENYGVTNPSLSDEIAQKKVSTCLQNFGVPYPSMSDKVLNKTKATNQVRYGCDWVTQNKTIRQKQIDSLYQHGNIATSAQQNECYQILLKHGYTVELNKPIGPYFFDIALYSGNVKIDIEYDGAYWHQDQEKDKRRDDYAFLQGYKVLRIKNSDKHKSRVPSEQQLISCINELINSDQIFLTLNL